MTDTDILGYALNNFAEIGEEAFALSLPYWQRKQYGTSDSFWTGFSGLTTLMMIRQRKRMCFSFPKIRS
jgi:hypothetical protein